MQGKQLFVCTVGVAMMLIVLDVVVVNVVHRSRRNIPIGVAVAGVSRTQQHNKWIIVSVEEIHHTDLKFLDDVSGWNILVVGRRPYLEDCKSPRCTFLHPGNMKHLNFRSTSHVEDHSFRLKNIGYLYAMSKSAEFIYDLEYGVTPINIDTHFILKNVTEGLFYTGNQTFNYYRYFGQPHLYPKGYPYSIKGRQSNYFKLCPMKTALVQHGIVAGDPFLYENHVHALLKIANQKPYDVQFDTTAPPIFLPPGKISVVSSGNTVFGRNALWYLLLPSAKNSFISGVIRGYIAQRLSWETGSVVGFMGVTGSRKYLPRETFQRRDNNESNHANMLIRLVTRWKCNRNQTMVYCFLTLFRRLVEQRIIDESNVEVVDSWIHDVTNMIHMDVFDRNHRQERYRYNQELCTNVYMSPNVHSHVVYNLSSMSATKAVPWKGHPVCPHIYEVRQALKNNSPPKYVFKDVLLVVIINYLRIYSSIGTVEDVYRRHFPNILYCGPNETSFARNGHHSTVSHIEGIANGWHFLYECVAFAMKMNYRVSGYLHIGDDTLLYLWNLFPLPRESVWFPDDLNSYRRSVRDYSWRWWKEAIGRRNMESVFAELREHSKNGSTHALLANQFFTNYVYSRKSLDMMYGKNCDFYYIPHRLKNMYVYLTRLLTKHIVIVELGLPTVLNGLDKREHIKMLPGKSMFGASRSKIEELFTTVEYFMHPVKFTPMFRDPSKSSFFCEKIQPLFEGSVQIGKSNTSLL